MYSRDERPEIVIGISSPEIEPQIQPLLYGIEEEGIPYKILVLDGKKSGESAVNASLMSGLGVGIGVDVRTMKIHTKNLNEDTYYLELNDYPAVANQIMKNFGSNSARLVKVIPLILENGRSEII